MMHNNAIAPHLQAFLLTTCAAKNVSARKPLSVVVIRSGYSSRFYESTPALNPPHCTSPMSMPPQSSAFSTTSNSSGATPCARAISVWRLSAPSSVWWPCAIRTASVLPRGCSLFRSSVRTKSSSAI